MPLRRPTSLLMLVLLSASCGRVRAAGSTLYRPCECPTDDCLCLRTRNCSTVDYVPISGQLQVDLPIPACGNFEKCCSVADTFSPDLGEEMCPPDDDVSGAYGGCGIWSAAGLTHMPWAGVLIFENETFVMPVCGVTIVHPSVVVTAAGCLRGHAAGESKTVVAGTDLPFNTDGNPHVQRVRVLRSMEMEYYEVTNGEDYDLALLELETPLSRDPGFVDVACLPQPDSRLDLCNCWTGGISSPSGEMSSSTSWKYFQVRVLKHETCQGLYSDLKDEYYELKNRFNCAVGDSSVCWEDYGGPVVCPLKEDGLRFVLAGVLGKPIACQNPEVPTLVVNAVRFGPWIQASLESMGYENYAVHPRY